MIAVQTPTGWIVGAVAAMAVLGVGALSPAVESHEELLVAKEGPVLVASPSVQTVVIPPLISPGQSAGPVVHRVSAQTGGLSHKVGTVAKSARKSSPSHTQDAPLTLEELRELERHLDQASISYWNTQLNPPQ